MLGTQKVGSDQSIRLSKTFYGGECQKDRRDFDFDLIANDCRPEGKKPQPILAKYQRTERELPVRIVGCAGCQQSIEVHRIVQAERQPSRD